MSMDLYIIGAGGFGREVYSWACDALDFDNTYNFCGFLDDKPDALLNFDYPFGVVGKVDGFRPNDSARFSWLRYARSKRIVGRKSVGSRGKI